MPGVAEPVAVGFPAISGPLGQFLPEDLGLVAVSLCLRPLAANGRNPISIVAPCHRVIGSNGALTGFAGGLAAKERLLGIELGKAAA
jgi:6-O-methylguanine DNA methyltransferase, DNA binding domain